MVGYLGKTWQLAASSNGHNYDTWANKMRTIMVANSLRNFVMYGFNNITNHTIYIPFQCLEDSAKGVNKKGCRSLKSN